MLFLNLYLDRKQAPANGRMRPKWQNKQPRKFSELKSSLSSILGGFSLKFMDGRTDIRTDTPSHTDARTLLKRWRMKSKGARVSPSFTVAILLTTGCLTRFYSFLHTRGDGRNDFIHGDVDRFVLGIVGGRRHGGDGSRR